MGLCSSHRRPRPQEREPLLPTTADERAAPESNINKAVDVLAAIHAGKLPSQDQVNRLLQHALGTDLLHDGLGGMGYGPLGESGRKVVADARELVEAALRVGVEKNHDDVLQDLLFHSASIDANSAHVDAEVVVDASKDVFSEMPKAPTAAELTADASRFIDAIKCVIQLLLTSAAFRVIISDILLTAREFVADVAADIGDVAHQVQVGAEHVETAARLGDVPAEALKGKVKEVVAEAKNVGANTGQRWPTTVDTAKDVVIARIQEVILQAHKNPEYRSALRTILLILGKYSQKLRASASAVQSAAPQTSPQITVIPIVQTDHHVVHALADLKTLLERAASGLSLDPLLHALSDTISDTIAAPSEAGSEVAGYFSGLGEWLDRALSHPQFGTSRHGTRAAVHLYDTGRTLLWSNAKWSQDVRSLLHRADAFTDALKSDPATVRFVRALDSLSSDAKALARDAVASGTTAQRRRREELAKDVWGWLAPRVLKSFHAIPMPRVEFQSSTLDVAVDALLFTAAGPPLEASLVPERLIVQNWSEVRLGPGADSARSSRVRVRAGGMRVSARGIGYYVRHRGLFAYADEGLLSLDLGGAGMSVDVVLETGPGAPLFRVADVHVTVPGLALAITRSKHWLVNALLVQPLARPVGRWAARRLVEAQVRTGLAAVERALAAVAGTAAKRAARRADVDADGGSGGDALAARWVDYWSALLEHVPSLFSQAAAPPGDRLGTPDAQVESHTTVGVKGVLRTTVTQPANGSASETVLAIGGGAQLFPGKGGPYNGDSGVDVLEGPGRDVEAAVGGLVGKMRGAAEGVVDGVARAREDLESAEIRGRVREREERHRWGWRSGAFDL